MGRKRRIAKFTDKEISMIENHIHMYQCPDDVDLHVQICEMVADMVLQKLNIKGKENEL